MKHGMRWYRALALSLVLAVGGFAVPADDAAAAKPDKAGKSHQAPGKAKHRGKAARKAADATRAHDGRDVEIIIRDYYAHEVRGGHCPPGLAKKNNGCRPPGHAKRWKVGERLPHDVVVYDLPHELLERLGRTPVGYKLVRVGADILKIAVGTGLVIEGIEDIGEVLR